MRLMAQLFQSHLLHALAPRRQHPRESEIPAVIPDQCLLSYLSSPRSLCHNRLLCCATTCTGTVPKLVHAVIVEACHLHLPHPSATPVPLVHAFRVLTASLGNLRLGLPFRKPLPLPHGRVRVKQASTLLPNRSSPGGQGWPRACDMQPATRMLPIMTAYPGTLRLAVLCAVSAL